MDGIPPALPTDSEDIAWALETAEALWRRGERVDAVVWVRRAAQAAGEGEDTRRAAALARYAAELGDWIGSNAINGGGEDHAHRDAGSEGALAAVDALLGPEGADAISLSDIEVVSAQDFEAGFAKPAPDHASPEPEVMTVSLHAPDVVVLDDDDDVEEFPEEEPTPTIGQLRSPLPETGPVPSAAETHAGMLDPWAEADGAKRPPAKGGVRLPPRTFDEEEVVTSAGRKSTASPPVLERDPDVIPPAPKPARMQAPPPTSAAKPGATPREEPEDDEDTTYRQINVRSPPRGPVAAPLSKAPPLKPLPPRVRPSSADRPALSRVEPPSPAVRAPLAPARRSVPAPPKDPSFPPPLDLLEMVDSIDLPPQPLDVHADGGHALTLRPAHATLPPQPTLPPRSSTPASARPTAPPPGSLPRDAFPSVVTTPPEAGPPPLDLGEVEALSDLPDDARDAFARAATMHTIATDEEVSHFALALVVEGEIDVSATIVDAPALRLARNSILRSRGSIVPGVGLRLVCASPSAVVATWNDRAVAAAFRTCPWVEEDLRAVTDRVQAKAGVTMGPLGERFDQSLREHLTSKLTVRNLAPGEVLIAQGKPTPIAIVGIGELAVTINGTRGETLGPGDFVFPAQTLAHAPAPGTAAAGAAGAVVLFGERSVAQELLMSFPPLLEVLATL